MLTKKNVVFDEPLYWWSPQKEELLDSKEIEDRLQQKLGEQIAKIRSSPEAAKKGKIAEEIVEHEEAQSPCLTHVYQKQPEETRPSEEEVVNP